MTDIQFYHLLSTPLEAALPKLLSTAYQRDMAACVVADAETVAMLDKLLWTFNPASFLPHGRADDGNAAQHPITLAVDVPSFVNNPAICMITNGHQPVLSDAPYQTMRIFDIFNGHDDGAVEHARQRWKAYDDASIPLKYIRQNDDGGWDIIKQSHQPDMSGDTQASP